MVETDWRTILSFSQKELLETDKDELCESLSWMEADDIELNFTDLKTLFRLAQDILKYKSEQVKNLLGELDTIHRKSGKKKSRNGYMGTSAKNPVETINYQEEMIKANKDILEQLYADIAELEGRKSRYNEEINDMDKESDSSPDALSQIDAKAQLQNEILKKNRHIRKLLGYIKILEEENSKLKDKISILKDKLKEATKIIEDMTEKMLNVNDECSRLKDSLGSLEQIKSGLLEEIHDLKQGIISKTINTEREDEDMTTKIHSLKNVIRTQKSEIENLSKLNKKLKEDLIQASMPASFVTEEKQNHMEELRIQELGNKLAEATNKIIQSTNIIENLKAENKQLKSIIQESHNVTESDMKNESDDGKERNMITKLRQKVKHLNDELHRAEDTIGTREKEIIDLKSQLNLVQSDEGIDTLLITIKNTKKQLKLKDERIKALVKDVNKINNVVYNLQIENEAMRQKLNLSLNDTVPNVGIIRKYHDLKEQNSTLIKTIQSFENQLVEVEVNNRDKDLIISKYEKLLKDIGSRNLQVDEIYTYESEIDNETQQCHEESENRIGNNVKQIENNVTNQDINVQTLLEENEGLRKGLREILNFMKDNNATSSGVLALECPSLEAVLHCLEARHAAGWFAPHIATTMELKAALGGKDALLTALHQSRKETFELMDQLSKESQKCVDLQNKLLDFENKTKMAKESEESALNIQFGEFNSWILDNEKSYIDVVDKSEIEKHILEKKSLYEREIKNALKYFRNKYKILFDKMTEIAIRLADEKSKWSILEESYKAQIEKFKSYKDTCSTDDLSDISPGLLQSSETSVLERKCLYLEESYKEIRTSFENMKNELLENKKHELKLISKYESQMQNLIIIIVNLSDKLRFSVPDELFWDQNAKFHEISTKYRHLVDKSSKATESEKNLTHFEELKRRILDSVLKEFHSGNIVSLKDEESKTLSHVDQAIVKIQLQEICAELETKNKQIEQLTKTNLELQMTQAKLIDDTVASERKEEIILMKHKLFQINKENGILREQCKHVTSQLNIIQLQLKEDNHQYLSHETEINMLRHQILDLQSTGDTKAIIARLSNEILVAHLQTTEYQKIVETLKTSLLKEKELRKEAEDVLQNYQRLCDMFMLKYENKFRYMFQIMQVMRFQYQGCIPLISSEEYLKNLEEITMKSVSVNEKLTEIEDLRNSLMTKHCVYEQILELATVKCSESNEDCSHKMQLLVSQGIQTRELEYRDLKLQACTKAHENLLARCNHLEKTLIILNQGSNNLPMDENVMKKQTNCRDLVNNHIEVKDIQFEEELSSKESGTFTLQKPLTTQLSNQIQLNSFDAETFTIKVLEEDRSVHEERVSVFTQTNNAQILKSNKIIQTDKDYRFGELNHLIETLENKSKQKDEKIAEWSIVSEQLAKRNALLSQEIKSLDAKIQNMNDANTQLIKLNEQLSKTSTSLKKELDDCKNIHREQLGKKINESNEEKHLLLLNVKKIENEKNYLIDQYKQLLENEREECSQHVKELQTKLKTLQADLDNKASTTSTSNAKVIKEGVVKYTLKNAELEDKCFKLQNSLDEYKTEVANCQSELKRWKDLASERLEKMEHMNLQLKERYNHEVESYKTENQHWLLQLNETQREHLELRTRLTEQKTLHLKQLTEKDAQIEQLRSVVHNLKTQITNMQTMLSVNDPSFDLSAIVEVEEASDISQQGSDRLELKYDSTVDLHEMQDDFARIPTTSTTIWQEPVIERLRREKQLISKQNGILRRQIKAIAGRERRARLDAQNLRNQVFRISTSGSKAVSAESAALHNKIASLQAQLTSARRDSNSSVALWDKWKRAQQASERWQMRYEEKFREVNKLEASLNLAKSAVTRLEKEKRVLLSRLADTKNDKHLVSEKQDGEPSEKHAVCRYDYDYSNIETVPVSTRALLERIEAQQRRIVALEVAEKGNEPLVSEYEKALAEITSLKGQLLKLESTLLETQIRSPIKNTKDLNPEIEYWKSYCDMLKEENAQLTLRVTSLESAPTSTHQHRVNDLEQTVLTLRGLVSKLQADQKSSTTNLQKRVDSRPSSGRSAPDKTRSQLESCRTEISNLKRSIQEKDALLEKSKDMLRIAAEREDELLKENTFLRQQLDELTDIRRGSLSA